MRRFRTDLGKLLGLIQEARQFVISTPEYTRLAQVAFRRAGQAIEKTKNLKKALRGRDQAKDHLAAERAHAHAISLHSAARNAALSLNRQDLADIHAQFLSTLQRIHRRHRAKATALLTKK